MAELRPDMIYRISSHMLCTLLEVVFKILLTLMFMERTEHMSIIIPSNIALPTEELGIVLSIFYPVSLRL